MGPTGDRLENAMVRTSATCMGSAFAPCIARILPWFGCVPQDNVTAPVGRRSLFDFMAQRWLVGSLFPFGRAISLPHSSSIPNNLSIDKLSISENERRNLIYGMLM